MKPEREVTTTWGVEWSPGDMEMWSSEREARLARDACDPDAALVKITEIKEYVEYVE